MTQANHPGSTQSERLLRLPEVEARAGFRKSRIYAILDRTPPAVPFPLNLSCRAVCWSSSVFEKWINERSRWPAMGAGTNLEQARALIEARKILHASIALGGAMWKRRIRFEWQTGFKRQALLELLTNFDLRVTDERTGDRIVQGPARIKRDRFPLSR